MSEEKKDEKEPRMLSFKFASKSGTVLCPYCFSKAVLVKAEKTAAWYACPCEAWQHAYAKTQNRESKS